MPELSPAQRAVPFVLKSSAQRWLHGALAMGYCHGVLAGCLTVLSIATAGCTSSKCPEGEVAVDGQCVARCEDALCAPDLYCVRSVCRPECSRDNECLSDDTCQSVVSDEGRQGRYCYGPAISPSPYQTDTNEPSAPDAGSPTRPDSCTASVDCDQRVSRVCVDGLCKTECFLHEQCGMAGACTGSGQSAERQSVAFCQGDEFPREQGQFGSQCLDGSSDCDAEAGFRCISTGEGDTDSYCTAMGCDLDTECPNGYFCSENRVGSRSPCAASCGLPGDPANPDCIAADQIGEGRPYRCSTFGGLSARLCLKRSFCSPCDSDADCRSEPGQVCARGPDGIKTCTVECAPEAGSCPWGASTECAVFDTELGKPTCAPRFGACRGDGSSCQPCTNDADCPQGFCVTSSFSGEQFCLDQSARCSCPPGQDSCTGGGCPATPGGLDMNCIPFSTGAAPSICYGAAVGGDVARFGCWN